MSSVNTGAWQTFFKAENPRFKNFNSAEDLIGQEELVQEELAKLGYFYGPIDGDWGPRSKAYMRNFQRAHGIQATGEIDDATLGALKFFRKIDFKTLVAKTLASPTGDTLTISGERISKEILKEYALFNIGPSTNPWDTGSYNYQLMQGLSQNQPISISEQSQTNGVAGKILEESSAEQVVGYLSFGTNFSDASHEFEIEDLSGSTQFSIAKDGNTDRYKVTIPNFQVGELTRKTFQVKVKKKSNRNVISQRKFNILMIPAEGNSTKNTGATTTTIAQTAVETLPKVKTLQTSINDKVTRLNGLKTSVETEATFLQSETDPNKAKKQYEKIVSDQKEAKDLLESIKKDFALVESYLKNAIDFASNDDSSSQAAEDSALNSIINIRNTLNTAKYKSDLDDRLKEINDLKSQAKIKYDSINSSAPGSTTSPGTPLPVDPTL